MKETTWSKLCELWAIRRHCKQIKLEQRQRWQPADQTTGGLPKSTTLPTGLTEVRFEKA
jgi:hypothetical protein